MEECISLFKRGVLILIGVCGCSCAAVRSRPCSEGWLSRSVHANAQSESAVKKCFQLKDEKGQWVNHGKYYEWYESEKIALIGEFKMGKKHGRWMEYDRQGNRISDRYFENGVELSP